MSDDKSFLDLLVFLKSVVSPEVFDEIVRGAQDQIPPFRIVESGAGEFKVLAGGKFIEPDDRILEFTQEKLVLDELGRSVADLQACFPMRAVVIQTRTLLSTLAYLLEKGTLQDQPQEIIEALISSFLRAEAVTMAHCADCPVTGAAIPKKQ